MVKKEVQLEGNGLYLQEQVAGHTVRFMVEMGSGMSLLATRVWNAWACLEEELGLPVLCRGMNSHG